MVQAENMKGVMKFYFLDNQRLPPKKFPDNISSLWKIDKSPRYYYLAKKYFHTLTSQFEHLFLSNLKKLKMYH